MRDTHTVCVGYVEVDTVKYWREVHCRRKEALVEVYELVEHGRQWWRALIYTSDASLSLGVPPPPAPGAVRADAFDVPYTYYISIPHAASTQSEQLT